MRKVKRAENEELWRVAKSHRGEMAIFINPFETVRTLGWDLALGC